MDEPTRILVVEDDSLLARLLEYKLVKSGFRVELAFDGETALAMAESRVYDILLIDLMMPRLDGFQLMQRLNDQPGPSPSVYVVLSARAGEEDMLRAFKLGAVDFITKPFSLDVLIARLRIALRCKAASVAE